MSFEVRKRIPKNGIFDYQTDAEEVLKELINDYGKATVKDLWDLIGVTPDSDDDKTGWNNLDDARIFPVEHRGKCCYCLELPNPVAIAD